ncbi:hypothetical protein KFU94_60425, partial [Chloroflexi bacterium TSY]|nr:hypothetical protein [Chloroflexi bacterium TSY]
TWSWDESRILTINEDNTVCIWDGESGKELFRLQHNEYVVLAMWNQNKNRVLTGSIDGAVRIWTVSLPDLQSKACDRVIANMDLTEWRSRMGGAYRPICEEAEIPLDVLPFVTNEVKEYADNGNLTAAAERLGQLVGWLHKNGQFNPFGVEWADWLTTLQAGENPWAEE